MAYSAVYSTQFVVRASSEPIVPYEVPSGFVAVVRDFSIWSNSAAAEVLLQIQNDDSAPVVVAAYLEMVGVGVGAQWQGRVVVPGGGFISNDQIDVGDPCHIYVGGYLLRDVTL